ncbi:tetratricopeptide repeat protein [Chryseobacterium wanjuense]
MDSIRYYAEKSLKSTMAIGEDENFVTKKYHNLAISYMNLGMLAVATNRIKDAEMYLSKSLEISQNPKYLVNKNIEVTVLNEFAWLYYDQKSTKKQFIMQNVQKLWKNRSVFPISAGIFMKCISNHMWSLEKKRHPKNT